MPRRFSEAYVHRLLEGSEYGNLVELASLIHGSPRIGPENGFLGLPVALYAFVEGLEWMAQCWRSGAITHFEAVPLQRQRAIHSALIQSGNTSMAEAYQIEMRKWDDSRVDDWADANHDITHDWFRSLLNEHRADVLAFTA